MAIGLFFFGANIVALTANLLTGAGLLMSNPRSFNARLFAAVTVSAACYLVGRLSYAVPADVQVSFYVWPFLLVFMNLATGFWMILAYSLFEDRPCIPRWMIAAFGVQALLSTINAFGYIGRDGSVLLSDAYPLVVNFVFGPLPLAMQSAFALLALYWAARGWCADLDESRRLLRGLFVAVVGGLSFGINVTELYLLDTAYAVRAPFDNAVTLVMAAGYVALVLAVFRLDAHVLERLLERTKLSRAAKADASELDRDFAKLSRALGEEKVYLTHGLTIGSLAKRLGVPEYRLRALINKRLGYRNFNALLHEHRLREACARLSDPAQAHLPILTIALDVGYQSIAPFNQAFRESLGCTPTEYRRKHLSRAGVTVSV